MSLARAAQTGRAAAFVRPEAPTVDPDCTGSFFDTDGAKTNNVVVLDGGKRFFLLSVAPNTIVMEEANGLEVQD